MDKLREDTQRLPQQMPAMWDAYLVRAACLAKTGKHLVQWGMHWQWDTQMMSGSPRRNRHPLELQGTSSQGHRMYYAFYPFRLQNISSGDRDWR